MQSIIGVTSFEDSKEVNYFPDFSSIQEFTTDKNLLIPQEVLNKVLNHLKLDSYQDTIVIAGFITELDTEQDEEIWDVSKVFELQEVLSKDLTINNFTWGYAALGFIKILDEVIPVYYTQNASPIGFCINKKYSSLIESLEYDDI